MNGGASRSPNALARRSRSSGSPTRASPGIVVDPILEAVVVVVGAFWLFVP
jgi:hypothetical protein